MKLKERLYDEAWPLGRKGVKPGKAASRLKSLDGKTICELWNYLYGGDQLFPLIEVKLKERFPRIKFIPYAEFGNTHERSRRKCKFLKNWL